VHSCSVIHGDLSGVCFCPRSVYLGLCLTYQFDQSNVLIDSEGRACVADFGMSNIKAEFQGTSYFTSSIGGAIRWAAPELYRIYEDYAFPEVTAACDVYSYGSVTLQVCLNIDVIYTASLI
jgi:serine/threonine protein kinase